LKPIPLPRFWLLMIITLGCYTLVLVPRMATAVNTLTRATRYRSGQVLIIGVLTVGMGFSFFETLYAWSLTRHPAYTRGRWSNRHLFAGVLMLNSAAWFFGFLGDIIAFVFSLGFGCWATWLVQKEINRYLFE